ncbi:MAG: hypothetical protein KC505_09965 [Myxococcales bacterium]|nr:hypothetical protein [Myxococcales bacterium]USN50928.1 MAG: hypothetical protein H6731_00480 [Myxococcales bacterium]
MSYFKLFILLFYSLNILSTNEVTNDFLDILEHTDSQHDLCDEKINMQALDAIDTASSLPTPDFSIIIEQDNTFLKELSEAPLDYFKESTGFSPKKGKSRQCVSVESPIKKLTKTRAKINITRKPKRLNLEQASKNDFHEAFECETIYSDNKYFSKGFYIYRSPGSLDGSVVLNSESDEWNLVIENMIKSLIKSDLNSFIASSIYYVNNNIEKFKHFIYFNQDDRMVCRHYSTLCLGIFSKLLESKKLKFYGHIQLMYCDFIDHKFDIYDEGHVWNLLRISKKKNETPTYYLLDLFRYKFINLSEDSCISRLKLKQVDRQTGKLSSRSLKPGDEYYNYAKITKEKFNISPSKKNNIHNQQNEDIQDIFAKRIFTKFRVPEDLIEINSADQ